jgi:hypothetical protein
MACNLTPNPDAIRALAAVSSGLSSKGNPVRRLEQVAPAAPKAPVGVRQRRIMLPFADRTHIPACKCRSYSS